MPKKEVINDLTPLWVSIRVLNQTISQLLAVIEDNMEESKYSALGVISVRANHLIDSLTKGLFLKPKTASDDDCGIVDIYIYKRLINTLVDITLVANYNINSNEVGILNECIHLLNIVENELLLFY